MSRSGFVGFPGVLRPLVAVTAARSGLACSVAEALVGDACREAFLRP